MKPTLLPRLRGRLAIHASLLALLAACGPAAEPVTPPPPVPPELAQAAAPKAENPIEKGDPQRIDADVKQLASDAFAGRGTGDAGAQQAAEHVEKRFRELGLEAFGDADGSGKSFKQKFSARVGAKVEAPTVSLAKKGQKAAKTPAAADVITAEGAQTGEAKGEVVFVGHGVTAPAASWDDYAGKEIAGKVALIVDGAPKPESGGKNAEALRDFKSVRYKLRTAREHKAVAAIVVAAGEELPAAPENASGMGIPAVVIKRSAAKALFPEIKWDDAAVSAPKAAVKPKALAGTELSVATRIEPTFADAWNVVARLPARAGTKTAEEYVVVGAHYDHLGKGGTSHSRAPGSREIHHGADDNASGTALLLDVARRFSKLAEKPARNIVFIAFGAEELGTLGSRHWVEHPPVPIGSVTAMINADMVGRMRDRTLVVDGTGTAAAWPELVNAANTGLSLTLKLGAEGFGASDHASFTAARVPVAFLFTGVHDDYHKPSDTADKVDVGGIDLAATLAARLTQAVAERPERLAFVEAPAAHDPHKGGGGGGGRAFRVSLGSIPDYAWQGKGVKLTGVRPDAPAARAGLQAGDIIVKLDKHEITNVHDYTFALGDLEPGREITVEVERDGKRVALKIIPAPGR
ncbi:M20/M25/M40 family metallo-hydrolase [Polyangium sorediatum]|uniref:M20/M25/M40 family metallo-hydrolase n=1 Tax=Polyangium sorediatum TaxID=889274 RepID=A0ABT6NRB2_9BACT|nr:M20/M25/M40 family metallo-hydrolase [Polyangium sorediatum]MDI1430715.1 M20/M25/M40 family metallo-hydrolase [Polyangium sorediatum]